MNFKFGMVVSYIPRSGIDIRKAAGEFSEKGAKILFRKKSNILALF